MKYWERMNQSQLVEEIQRLNSIIQQNNLLFERLDEACTPSDVIAQHTKDVGGFVSGLNIAYTEEEIVDKACKLLNHLKDEVEKK